MGQKLTYKVGFSQLFTDECIFYEGLSIYLLYTDNSTLVGPNKAKLKELIVLIRKSKLNITKLRDLKKLS